MYIIQARRFLAFLSFQSTQPGFDPALIKANGIFAINLMAVGKNLSQAVSVQALDYFVPVKVFALVALFLIASIFMITCIPSVLQDPDWDHSFTMLCTVQTGTWRGNPPQRACDVNRQIRESWQVKDEGCAEGTQLAWSGWQGWGTQPSLFGLGSVLPSTLLCPTLD